MIVIYQILKIYTLLGLKATYASRWLKFIEINFTHCNDFTSFRRVEIVAMAIYSLCMKGWPSAFTKSEQYRFIAQCLPFFTHQEIWEILNISKATFYRRLNQLEEMLKKPPSNNDREQVLRVLAELEAAARASNLKQASK